MRFPISLAGAACALAGLTLYQLTTLVLGQPSTRVIPISFSVPQTRVDLLTARLERGLAAAPGRLVLRESVPAGTVADLETLLLGSGPRPATSAGVRPGPGAVPGVPASPSVATVSIVPAASVLSPRPEDARGKSDASRAAHLGH